MPAGFVIVDARTVRGPDWRPSFQIVYSCRISGQSCEVQGSSDGAEDVSASARLGLVLFECRP